MLTFLDSTLFHSLNAGAANPVFDRFMPWVTNLNHQAWFFACVALLVIGVLWKGNRQARVWVICALVAVGISDITAARVAKRWITRDRPCYQAAAGTPMEVPDDRLVPGTHCPGSHSFPSNHASNMMALGLVCCWFTRGRKRWLWLLLPVVIGYSRIYLGFHYPTDVIGGWLFGAFIASVVLAVGVRFLRAKTKAEPRGEGAEESGGLSLRAQRSNPPRDEA